MIPGQRQVLQTRIERKLIRPRTQAGLNKAEYMGCAVRKSSSSGGRSNSTSTLDAALAKLVKRAEGVDQGSAVREQ
jgi:hypothetical protein